MPATGWMLDSKEREALRKRWQRLIFIEGQIGIMLFAVLARCAGFA